MQLPKRVLDRLFELYRQQEKDFYVGYANAGYNKGDAQGVAIHDELLLAFGDYRESASKAIDVARVYLQVPHAVMAPNQLSKPHHTVMTYLSAENDAVPLAEHWLRHWFGQLVDITEVDGSYGMFNYKDIHNGFNPYCDYWGLLHRVWSNAHYNLGRIGYLMYLRSGRHEYYAPAQAFARHIMNVDTCNFAPSDGSAPAYHAPGAVYHCKGFVQIHFFLNGRN